MMYNTRLIYDRSNDIWNIIVWENENDIVWNIGFIQKETGLSTRIVLNEQKVKRHLMQYTSFLE